MKSDQETLDRDTLIFNRFLRVMISIAILLIVIGVFKPFFTMLCLLFFAIIGLERCLTSRVYVGEKLK